MIFFDPQIITDYHRLASCDFDEVLKDRRFPVLSAEAKLVLPQPTKWKSALLQRIAKITFRLDFWMKSVKICENLWINKYPDLTGEY